MGKKDTRVDAYIDRSADFAKPILRHIRTQIHTTCPQVEETIKWGMPSFTYHGILCGLAAFRQHCTFGFWHRLMNETVRGKSNDAMGQFGRITSLSDLPSDSKLRGYIKQAMKLNADGVKAPQRSKPKSRPPIVVPDDLAAALKKNARARAAFDEFSYSHQKEYTQWITEAKRPEIRQKRLKTAIEGIARGKSRNWKYERC